MGGAVRTRKVDRKRAFRHLYAPGPEPEMVDVPEMTFLMLDGTGDPNTAPAYRTAIEALYAVSYTIKFAIKRGETGVDHVVMPLEGLWWVPNMSLFSAEDKDAWRWTMMISQPDEVTDDMVRDAIGTAGARKPLPAAPDLRLERLREGLSAQVMYIGPFAEEGPTIERLHAFLEEQGYRRTGKHHEIYLSDPRRTAPEKLKTVIRQPVS